MDPVGPQVNALGLLFLGSAMLTGFLTRLSREPAPGPSAAPAPEGGRANGASAGANLGVVRPPLVYAVSILTGVVLDLAWPLPFVPRALRLPFGASLVIVAIALMASAVRKFWTVGTPVPGNRPTTAIVRSGPYRISRNPIYLAFSLLHLGAAVWVGSWWLLLTLVVSVALMIAVVVPREERYLQERFGDAYLSYKASVRRWL